jgi:hypothetical protein
MTNSSAINPKQKVHWITHATFWSQVGLGLIGIAALWIYHCQLTTMQGQLDQMNKQYPEIQKSAAAAKSAADTAGQTLTQNIGAFRIDERAWVVVDQVALVKSFPPREGFPGFFSYGLYAKNIGKTLASNVRIHVDSFWGFGELNKHGIEMTQGRTWGGWNGKDPAPDKAGPSSLAPGERSLFPITTVEQAPTGGFVETVVGRIDYVDVFGVQHWKNFCYTVIDDKGTLSHCQGGGNDEDHNEEPAPK